MQIPNTIGISSNSVISFILSEDQNVGQDKQDHCLPKTTPQTHVPELSVKNFRYSLSCHWS